METQENHTPFKATHPGYLLKDELEVRSISQSDFAIEIGIHKTMLNEIIKGKRPITADLALILERALEIPADYWMRFQTQYELDAARVKEKNVQKFGNIDAWKIIKEHVPVSYFKRIGYFVGEIVNDIAKVKDVYGINHVEELPILLAQPEYQYHKKSDKLKISKKNVLAWNVVAKYEAKRQAVEEFKPDYLPKLCEELQTIFYQNSSSVEEVGSKLNQYGIKFVLVSKLEQTPIDGYTFWSENNPSIALTLRHSRIDNFAFTIMHEIGHIDLHIKNDREKQFFDLQNKGPIIEQFEKDANEYAKDKLIPDRIWEEIRELPDFSDANIHRIASKYTINPAIILGRIQHDFRNYNSITLIDKKLN